MPRTPIEAKIIAEIAANGPLCVSDYMAMCLTDPEHGYYRRAEAIGRTGDFITAPEISQIFGELIGAWAVQTWRDLGEPAPFQLIELGPGRGVLMADAMRAAKAAPDFVRAARLHLVESSDVMRRRQSETLGAYNTVWLNDLSEASPLPSIVIANEFLDALPIRQFVFEGGAWRRRRIAVSAGNFYYIACEPVETDIARPEGVEGAIFEDSPARMAVVDQFARLASGNHFTALIIDYGHNGEAGGDTLQAVSQHGFASVLERPGEVDLSAHVDFAALMNRAKAATLRTFGAMPMGLFLLRLGIGERLHQLLAKASHEQQEALIAGVRRLTSPVEMGELFRVAAITSGPTPPPFEVTR